MTLKEFREAWDDCEFFGYTENAEAVTVWDGPWNGPQPKPTALKKCMLLNYYDKNVYSIQEERCLLTGKAFVPWHGIAEWESCGCRDGMTWEDAQLVAKSLSSGYTAFYDESTGKLYVLRFLNYVEGEDEQ